MNKVILKAIMLLLLSNGFCQNKDSVNKVLFGFNLGVNYTNIQIKKVDPSIQTSNSAGFRIGILMNWKIKKHLSFSPKAELSFNNSKVLLLQNLGNTESYQVYPILMDFALHFTYSFNAKRLAPYILIGPSYKVPLTENKKNQYASKRSDFAMDFGIGVDKKLTYFSLAPELRYSLGLINISEIKLVDQLYFHTLTLVLNFKN